MHYDVQVYWWCSPCTYAVRCSCAVHTPPQHTGLLGGALLCAVAGVVMGFTLFVLVRFTEYYRAHSYQGLVRRALGKKTAMGTAAILGLYLFGGCIAYLVIIGMVYVVGCCIG